MTRLDIARGRTLYGFQPLWIISFDGEGLLSAQVHKPSDEGSLPGKVCPESTP